MPFIHTLSPPFTSTTDTLLVLLLPVDDPVRDAKRFNHGQTCCAGSRVFVHESVYDRFIQKFTETLKSIKVGDPFQHDTYQGPQVSQVQYDVGTFPLSFTPFDFSGTGYIPLVVLGALQRITNYINIGKKEGATLHLGGERHGTEGYFIQPTIFTDVKPGMTIVKEEIFGPGMSPPIALPQITSARLIS